MGAGRFARSQVSRRVDAGPNPETSRVDNRSVVAVLHDENDDTIIVSNMDCQSDDQQQPS